MDTITLNASRRIRYRHGHLHCFPTAAAAEALMLIPKLCHRKARSGNETDTSQANTLY